MAAPASTLNAKHEDRMKKEEIKIGEAVGAVVPTVLATADAVGTAVKDVPGLVHKAALEASTQTINTSPKPKEEEEEEEPLGTEEYEEINPIAKLTGFALSNNQKRKVLKNGYKSGQLFTGMQRHVIKIFSGDEVYDLSIRDRSNTSMYDNDTPIVNKEDAIFVNRAPTIAIRHSEVVRTLSEFNQNYLGWMDNLGETKERRRDMKNLFIFIFNNNTLNDVTTSFKRKLQRISHTNLTIEDKLPCGDELYKDFLQCLKYRLVKIEKELQGIEGVAGGNLIKQKFTLKKGLEDLIRIMEGGFSRSCLKYDYGSASDYAPLMDLAEQNRLMRLFKKFYLDDRPFLEKEQLQRYMADKKTDAGFLGEGADIKQSTFDALYEDIIQKLRDKDLLQTKLTHALSMNETLEKLLKISIQISDLKEAQVKEGDEYHRIEARFFADRLTKQYGVLEESLKEVAAEHVKDALEVTRILIKYSGRVDAPPPAELIPLKDRLELIKQKYESSATHQDIANLAEEAIEMLRNKNEVLRRRVGIPKTEPEAPVEARAQENALLEEEPKAKQAGGKRKATPEQKVKALFNTKYDNTETKIYCDTMLTLLLIDLKRQMDDFNVDKFLKKVGTTISDVKGVCPAVFHVLKLLVDQGSEQVVEEGVYIFSPQQPLGYADDTLASLEQKFTVVFDDKEKNAFENITPIRFYRRTPQEYRGLLGDCPYFITGHSKEEEAELRGVETELYEEPVYMTADEKRLMMQGGIPMGALMALYFIALAKEEKSDFVS